MRLYLLDTIANPLGIVEDHREELSPCAAAVKRRLMQPVTISHITEYLQKLPPEKLTVVYDFVSCLAENKKFSEAFQTMSASESVLGRDWERPEEDEAWANL
jgi:hypothetical protein